MRLNRRQFALWGVSAAAASTLALPSLAQGSDVLGTIKSSGKLRVGVTSAEPWFFKDPISEEWSGVGVQMGKRLAEALGVEMVPVETSWANSVAALQAGQMDIMFVLDPTEERKKALDFPEAPLFYYALGALVQPDSVAKTWDELDQKGVRIAVTLGTSVDKTMTERMKTAEISRFSSNDEAVAAFAARRVDVVAQFHPALVVQYARLRQGKVILPTPVTPVATSAGLAKAADPSLRDWVSQQFVALYSAGVPDQIFKEYLTGKGIDPSGIPGLIKEQWS